MTDDMGTFRTDIELENPALPGDRRRVEALLVDTGSELTWVPAPLLESLRIARVKRLRFRQATGQIVERWTGEARVCAAGTQTIDDVVFGEPGDQSLLGARTLEGLNVVVDPVSRRLVDAGAMPAAASAGIVVTRHSPAAEFVGIALQHVSDVIVAERTECGQPDLVIAPVPSCVECLPLRRTFVHQPVVILGQPVLAPHPGELAV